MTDVFDRVPGDPCPQCGGPTEVIPDGLPTHPGRECRVCHACGETIIRLSDWQPIETLPEWEIQALLASFTHDAGCL
jgi:hypothetical protein